MPERGAIAMTLSEAKTIVEEFWRNNGNFTEEEEFLFLEAADYLIANHATI